MLQLISSRAMRTLIVYISYHHGNTEVIARAMGKVLEAELRSPESTTPGHMESFDLIGFGSGNYFNKFDKRLISFIDDLPKDGRDAFIFSTSGSGAYEDAHRALRKHLADKGFRVVGEWHCKAFDTYGPLRLLGGLNKGRPDAKDIESAKSFAALLRAGPSSKAG
jgi:flavodoxin